ncbi:MAG: LytTR family DNA-binding domain-containing protein [Lysobacterales bacterium]
MMKLKTIVVDDEALARKLVLSCLKDLPEVEVIKECSNGREAIDAVLALEPDLMVLDISMPGLNGFEVIKKIQPELLPMVIFCTAYERYALDAFDVHAVDYIVKPLDEQRLHLAVKRALARYMEELHLGEDKASLLGAIDEIARKVEKRSTVRQPTNDVPLSPDPERRITIRDRDSIKLIKIDSIAWVDAAGDYMCVHAEGETHIMRCTMTQLLEELDDDVFKRVHRSTIVNLNCIEEVIPHTKGEYFLQISHGERIKVSRNYRDTIKSFLTGFN